MRFVEKLETQNNYGLAGVHEFGLAEDGTADRRGGRSLIGGVLQIAAMTSWWIASEPPWLESSWRYRKTRR
jgi:hypothetical protein